VRRRRCDVHLDSRPQMLEYEAIARRIAGDRPGRVLDWGCGYGQVAHMLLERGVDVTAFEHRAGSPGPTTVRLERYPEIEAHVSPDPVALPFGDGSFDAVLSCGVLEHVRDPDASLDEIHRVLRPQGTFYVYKLPNRFSYLERGARVAGLYYHGALPDDRVYTLDEARQLLERHAFEVRESRRTDVLPLTVGGRVLNPVAKPFFRANELLQRLPGLNLVATNLELVARRR
jgi:SAM-dependent methyltransferase